MFLESVLKSECGKTSSKENLAPSKEKGQEKYKHDRKKLKFWFLNYDNAKGIYIHTYDISYNKTSILNRCFIRFTPGEEDHPSGLGTLVMDT